MMRRSTLGVSVLLAAATTAAILSGDLHFWSTQEALNVAATGLIDQTQLRRYSTQEAANLIAQNTLTNAEAQSYVATMVFVVDDNNKEWFNGTVGAAATPIRPLLKTDGIKVGFSVEAYQVEHQDTATLALSVTNLQALKRDGHELGSGGWDESSWFNSDTGLLATGAYTQAQLAAAMDLHFSGNVRAMRDTLGLGTPRYHSWSFSSGNEIMAPYARAAGIVYGVSFPETATMTAAQGNRQNQLYPVEQIFQGMWGTGGTAPSGTAGARLCAVPGIHLDRYSITASLGEASDTAATYTAIRRALQFRGLIVWNGHRLSTWENALQGANGVKAVFDYLKTLQDAGRLRVMTPSSAFDEYYVRPIAPTVNFALGNWQDLDNEGHRDFWFGNRGQVGAGAADTAKIKLEPGTIRHGGKRAVSLNWTPGQASTSITGNTVDSTFEMTHACMLSVPPAGGGWTAKFECWLAIDSTVASFVHVSTSANKRPDLVGNKRFGVIFYAPMLANQNRYGGTQTWKWWTSTTANDYSPMTNYEVNSGTVSPFPGSTMLFTRKNYLFRPSTPYPFEWAHFVATFEVPEFSDHLIVSLWKDSQFPANEIVVSDYSLTYFKRDN